MVRLAFASILAPLFHDEGWMAILGGINATYTWFSCVPLPRSTFWRGCTTWFWFARCVALICALCWLVGLPFMRQKRSLVQKYGHRFYATRQLSYRMSCWHLAYCLYEWQDGSSVLAFIELMHMLSVCCIFVHVEVCRNGHHNNDCWFAFRCFSQVVGVWSYVMSLMSHMPDRIASFVVIAACVAV